MPAERVRLAAFEGDSLSAEQLQLVQRGVNEVQAHARAEIELDDTLEAVRPLAKRLQPVLCQEAGVLQSEGQDDETEQCKAAWLVTPLVRLSLVTFSAHSLSHCDSLMLHNQSDDH